MKAKPVLMKLELDNKKEIRKEQKSEILFLFELLLVAETLLRLGTGECNLKLFVYSFVRIPFITRKRKPEKFRCFTFEDSFTFVFLHCTRGFHFRLCSSVVFLFRGKINIENVCLIKIFLGGFKEKSKRKSK
jgi:hypothetical protein